MNNRARALAVLNYEDFDRVPVTHFGFWDETLQKWAAEGHLTPEEARCWTDGNWADISISRKLGFDFNWFTCFFAVSFNPLLPPFSPEILEELPDGTRKVLNEEGVVILKREGAGSIPAEVDHTLKTRKDWEESYLPRLQFSEERLTGATVTVDGRELLFGEGGLEHLRVGAWENPYGLFCGSLYGVIRNWLGLVGLSYLQVDDPALFDEIIQTVGELCYQCVRRTLELGATFDFAHFWEDICFRNAWPETKEASYHHPQPTTSLKTLMKLPPRIFFTCSWL